MLYIKNLSGWHRTGRLVAAVLMASCAAHYGLTPVGIIFGIASLVTGLTAVFGYCPMCKVGGKPRIADKS
ncbi:MAG: DUF2892 domain-containing protein [Pseudomonadota bacterium]